jgi:S-adenosylmethionine synthetase
MSIQKLDERGISAHDINQARDIMLPVSFAPLNAHSTRAMSTERRLAMTSSE